MTIRTVVNKKLNEGDIQVNMTYDDMSDMIYAIANRNAEVGTDERNTADKILEEYKAALNGAAKEIDGE